MRGNGGDQMRRQREERAQVFDDAADAQMRGIDGDDDAGGGRARARVVGAVSGRVGCIQA